MLTAVPVRRVALVWLVAAAFSLSLVGLLTSPVRAATITVTTTVDELNADGDCSLREAVVTANTDTAVDACGTAFGGDIITLPAGVYTLGIAGSGEDAAATGDLDIFSNVTINGAGAGSTIIDAGDIDRVLHLLAGAQDVTISGVTIRNGSADGGGGILVDAGATLGLTNSAVSDNQSTSPFGAAGGGILINGTATLTGVTVSGNTSSGGAEANRGGGIYIGGTATLTEVTVSGNTVSYGWGGGIDIDGTATLTGVTISGNTAGDGGGINVGGTGVATLTGGTVSGNTAGLAGGILINGGGTATLTGVTVSGNFGGNSAGGIYVGGTATLTGVTVSGNTAGDGGGIYLNRNGSLTMRNSTVSGNSGGGLFTYGDALIEFSTITNNTGATGGAGLTAAIGTVDLFASIIALNNGDECDTPEGSINSLGSNLSSDATCSLDQASDKPSIANPMLGTLASNGGSTQTHALLAGSAAIDAVQLVGPQLCLGTDQRGITRPQDGDRNGTLVCDIGAYELIPIAASITDVIVTEGNSGTVDAVFTVTLSRASTGTVSFAFATANGTATAPSDYQAATGTVTFAPGDTSETITVRVVGDTVDEPNETFVVDLSAPVGAAIADAQGTGTILDDEGPIVTPAAPAAGQLPDTGTTGADPLDGSMPLGLAIAGLVGSALAFPSVRRTVSRTTR